MNSYQIIAVDAGDFSSIVFLEHDPEDACGKLEFKEIFKIARDAPTKEPSTDAGSGVIWKGDFDHLRALTMKYAAVKVPEIVLFSGGIIKYVSSKLTAVISH